MTNESEQENKTVTPSGRINPATDPIKNILDKLYDGALKYLFSNTVPMRVKAGTFFALYSAIAGTAGYFDSSHKPSEELNETSLYNNIDQFMTTRNVAGQCYYEDKSKRLQVLFTEKSTLTTIMDILTSIATVTSYTAKQTERPLGTLPVYVTAPCNELNPATRIDANNIGMLTHSAVSNFMNAAKQGKTIESAQASKGYYSIRTITVNAPATEPK